MTFNMWIKMIRFMQTNKVRIRMIYVQWYMSLVSLAFSFIVLYVYMSTVVVTEKRKIKCSKNEKMRG